MPCILLWSTKMPPTRSVIYPLLSASSVLCVQCSCLACAWRVLGQLQAYKVYMYFCTFIFMTRRLPIRAISPRTPCLFISTKAAYSSLARPFIEHTNAVKNKWARPVSGAKENWGTQSWVRMCMVGHTVDLAGRVEWPKNGLNDLGWDLVGFQSRPMVEPPYSS